MNKKNYFTIRKIILITLVTVLWIVSFGGNLFEYNYPKLDLNDEHVYIVNDLGSILQGMKNNSGQTYDEFNSEYVCANVKIDSIGSRKMTVTSGGYTGIVIRTDSAVPSALKVGNTCSVFGQLKLGRNNLSMTLKDALVRTDMINTDADYYTLVNGNPRAFYDDRSELRTMNGGKITCRIPETWNRVRCTGEEKERIFHTNLMADADCYFLNGLSGKDSPECFIVFYFDIKSNVQHESAYPDYLGIENAIIKDICPDDSGFTQAARGVQRLFVNGYARSLNHMSDYGPCRVEFIFNETEGGIVVMMYVTESAYNYREEALYIQKTLTFQ